MRAESALAHGEQEKTGMFEVPPLCENESDDAPNGSYDLISSFGTYTNQKPHRVSLKKLGWINGVNPLAGVPGWRASSPVNPATPSWQQE